MSELRFEVKTRIDENLFELLRKVAEEEERSDAAILRRALRFYLAKPEWTLEVKENS